MENINKHNIKEILAELYFQEAELKATANFSSTLLNYCLIVTNLIALFITFVTTKHLFLPDVLLYYREYSYINNSFSKNGFENITDEQILAITKDIEYDNANNDLIDSISSLETVANSYSASNNNIEKFKQELKKLSNLTSKGPNGTGKTTLSKELIYKVQLLAAKYEGQVKIGYVEFKLQRDFGHAHSNIKQLDYYMSYFLSLIKSNTYDKIFVFMDEAERFFTGSMDKQDSTLYDINSGVTIIATSNNLDTNTTFSSRLNPKDIITPHTLYIATEIDQSLSNNKDLVRFITSINSDLRVKDLKKLKQDNIKEYYLQKLQTCRNNINSINQKIKNAGEEISVTNTILNKVNIITNLLVTASPNQTNNIQDITIDILKHRSILKFQLQYFLYLAYIAKKLLNNTEDLLTFAITLLNNTDKDDNIKESHYELNLRADYSIFFIEQRKIFNDTTLLDGFFNSIN